MDTLTARLRAFPKFYSLDGAHWLRSTDIEPLALEAAARLESLEAALADCAPKEPLAARLSLYGMYDCHNFDSLRGRTVDEVIERWRDMEDKTMLCPVIVLDARDKELRRVGPMVFRAYDGTPNEKQLADWRAACLADPDIPRLLKGRKP